MSLQLQLDNTPWNLQHQLDNSTMMFQLQWEHLTTRPFPDHPISRLIMWGSMPLLTVSTTVITVFHSAEVIHIPHEYWFRHPSATRKSPFCNVYTFYGVWPKDHYKAFQWLHLASNVPTEISPEVLATTKPSRAPSCALWVLNTTKPTHLQPDRLSSNTICTTGCTSTLISMTYWVRPYPYRLHGCTIFMGGRSMNRSLDLDMIANQRLSTTTRHSPELLATIRHSFMGGRSMNRSLDLDMIANQRLSATTRHSPELLATIRHSFHSCHPKS
jgi:hypothetical protein